MNYGDLWDDVVRTAMNQLVTEVEVSSLVKKYIIERDSLADALANLLADRFGVDAEIEGRVIRESFAKMTAEQPEIEEYAWEDLCSHLVNDPACTNKIDPILYFKGFQALQAYRLAHWLWKKEKCSFAKWIQWRISCSTGIDIHPAAKIGKGIFIDHGTGIVIGETAEIGDGVAIYHNVTLGGTGKDTGLRHPIVGDNVVLYAGATALGRIKINSSAIIAAGSLVLKDVPTNCTMVGIPARPLATASKRLVKKALDISNTQMVSSVIGSTAAEF